MNNINIPRKTQNIGKFANTLLKYSWVKVEITRNNRNIYIFLMLTWRYAFIDFRERERNINVKEKHQPVASIHNPTGDWDCNLSLYSDWEWNPQPLCVWEMLQPTEPHGQGENLFNWMVLQAQHINIWEIQQSSAQKKTYSFQWSY